MTKNPVKIRSNMGHNIDINGKIKMEKMKIPQLPSTVAALARGGSRPSLYHVAVFKQVCVRFLTLTSRPPPRV